MLCYFLQTKPPKFCVFCTPLNLDLASFPVLSSHMQLLVIVLDHTDLNFPSELLGNSDDFHGAVAGSGNLDLTSLSGISLLSV